ncbi:uncharacterized protein FTOL_07849 [Fusarium torulosum]|uniref:Pesticidal crystal protein N-terminal domain-containing protein n=1 Tax=Fusarium torulosum TaxID=33205 RepID=A0AAE8MCI9_9HYPO|nr:uncharacterized protein FTOL_07849 [Fusarium torulosum]
MGIEISGKFVNDLTTKLIKAADGSQKLEVKDPEEIGQFVCSILALGCELIPVVGSSLGALTTLFSSLLFHPNSIEKIWEKLRERIEKLIDSKITETQMAILKKKIRGLQDNMANYKRIVEDFQGASAEDLDKARDTLKMTHIAFLSVVRNAIPEFRVEAFAVASLPLFALAANIHLMLLSEGIKHGSAWGYSKKNVETMRAEFQQKTSSKGHPGGTENCASEQSSLLKGVISAVPDLSISTDIVNTWEKAYSDLVAPASGYAGNDDNNDDLDYVTYVNKIYWQGRGQVKPYPAELANLEYENQGTRAAAKLRSYADYDSGMVMNVLNYAEFWPYLAGGEMPESVMKKLDREIFFGPFGRYTTHASWTESSAATITDRSPRITSVYVRGWDDVDGLQIKYGDSWGYAYGSTTGGKATELPLAEDEYIYWVSVYYGHKLGKVRFWNNKDKALESGSAKNGSYYAAAAPPGYRLTSVYITNWKGATPPGCEGIILGFRPSIFEYKA